MLCFLPPMPAQRPEPPTPAPSPERAAEVVLLIFIVLNVFFLLAALAQPLIGAAGARPVRADPHAASAACKAPGEPTRAPAGVDAGFANGRSCRQI